MIDIFFLIMVIMALLFMFSLGYSIGYKSAVKFISASIYTIVDKAMNGKDTQD